MSSPADESGAPATGWPGHAQACPGRAATRGLSRLLATPTRGLLSAVQFLTRIPIPARWTQEPFDLTAAAPWFPLIGAGIGLFTGAIILAAGRIWLVWPAVVLGLACEALLTGALHEDALADFCDAFGGGASREGVLRILDDSRVGSYGALGLALGVFLRAGLLASLSGGQLVAAAIGSAALGRWAMLPAMAALAPIAGRESLAEQHGRTFSGWQVLLGSLLALPGVLPMAWLMPARTVCAGAVLIILVPASVLYVRRRIGGLTGDCLGAICYAGQLAVLACAAAGRAP